MEVSVVSHYAPDGVTLACGRGPNEYDTVWLLNTETGEHGQRFHRRQRMVLNR